MDATLIAVWAEFAVRWLHVITAIAWIGSSFYFIALDLGLRRDRALGSGADGEEWQVHGGGFYHIQKYLVAPASLPEHLTWFKWESYWTWISGFLLLTLVYWHGAELFLIDPAVMELSVWQAVAISAASLAFGWIVYDLLCKALLKYDMMVLMAVLFVVILAMALFYTSVFSGRAALLHLGAFTASIMTGNVFFVIIPNQKIVVADLKAGQKPDPKFGKIAKQRSTHNNYLTLPVIFLMLSTHYPLAFGGENAWLIAALVFLMGVSIRHFFNSMHARKGRPWWTWGLTAAIFATIVWLSWPPPLPPEEEAALTPAATHFATAPGFEEVQDIVLVRCSMCHSAEPGWNGIIAPPRGVRLDSPGQIAAHAREIWMQAGLTHAMPPANASYMEPEERIAIRRWFEGAS
ncbi:MAG: urate hydroxylase PuuD [Rubellimicrobium sp.]|nr:urate hydroxylase PuuD [Rubellimicrobium sp.]